MSERLLKNHLQAGSWKTDSWMSTALYGRLLKATVAAILQQGVAKKSAVWMSSL